MTLTKIVQRVHLWAGLVLGIQIFLWMLSGVVMTWFHLDLVRGERAAFSSPAPELDTTSYASPGGVIAQLDGANRVELRYFRGRPVYEVESMSEAALFDAMTGDRLTPLTEKIAREVAKSDFVGEGKVKQVRLLHNPPAEYKGKTPVWRADIDDQLNTRLYISRDTGDVLARRNDVWRLYDFFWMLHIMDFDARKNFNNPLVKGFSLAGLLFAFSGLVMLVTKPSRRQIVQDVKFITGRGGRSS
ncbi:MAG: hypothetical protein DHS20C05_17740 [Hyphococcus sp.]|nr:MAG: hypothetical protein DHS20C05_17740 [Marinicaulis sp.]